MLENEFRPDIGKSTIFEHQAELEQGLRHMALALGSEGENLDLSTFFHNFMSGFWNPFEEVSSKCAEQQRDLTAAIQNLESELKAEFPSEPFAKIDRYGTLLSERNSSALDYAFLVGFQCAIRFLLLGLAPAAKIYPQEVQR